VFQIEMPEMQPRTANWIAEAVSNEIKESSNHTHIFNSDTIGRASKITTLPIRCCSGCISENISFDDFVSKVESDIFLRDELTAYSIKRMQDTNEPAVLSLKKLYSSIFDRATQRHKYYQDVRAVFTLGGVSGTGIAVTLCALMFAGIASFGVSFALLGGVSMASGFIVGAYLTLSVAASVYIWFHVSMVESKNLRLLETALAYFHHGNNMVAMIARLFAKSDGQLDFNAIDGRSYFSESIALLNLLHARVSRRIANIYFIYSFGVALVGIGIALLS
jgi:hypothetical protein